MHVAAQCIEAPSCQLDVSRGGADQHNRAQRAQQITLLQPVQIAPAGVRPAAERLRGAQTSCPRPDGCG